MATAVTRKGQVTIPKAVRDAVGLPPGTLVEFGVEQGRAVLQAVPKDDAAEREARRADMARRVAAFKATWTPIDFGTTTEEIMAEIREPLEPFELEPGFDPYS